ncbi:MAG: polysaccharide deacetylase family protein [Verrucomicrobiota bacterium]
MTVQALISRAERACQRRAARWLVRRPFTLPRGRAIISFTFDDFPRSALLEGGAILEHYNLAGTYYTALGLSGRTTVCGEMFHVDELPSLLDLGHELGCHTFDHHPAWETDPVTFESSVLHNADALKEHLPHAHFRTLSYPISYPRPETKDRVGYRFVCCRGGGQTFNHGTVDLNYLSAFFLEQSIHRPRAVRDAILANQAAGGWLIFATHDVCAEPSPYGCTPEFFRDIVHFAVDSGALILPVGQAWDTIHARTPFLS